MRYVIISPENQPTPGLMRYNRRMTVTLRYPTPLATLEVDETYQKYLSRKPKMPKIPEISPAWLILGHTLKDTWVRSLESDYKEAFRKLKLLQEKPKIRDVCLVSRRKVFAKPHWLEHSPFEEWCGRCRRPTLFQPYYLNTHHAWPDGQVWLLNEKRCFFCGIRPSYFSDRARLNNA